MEKSKLLTFSVIALFLINISILLFLYGSDMHGNNPQKRLTPRNIIIERLHFNRTQRAQYDSIIRQHRETIAAAEYEIRNTKDQLYRQLASNNVDNRAKDSLIDLLCQWQRRIESAHFDHFESIKKICREGQIADFNRLSAELSHIFSHPPPGK